MLRKFLIILFFASIGKLSFCQIHPSVYTLNKSKAVKDLSADANPNGNSIDDIIAMGDTIWVGTDVGVSLSTNDGNSWTNFSSTKDFHGEGESAMGYDSVNKIFWTATAHSEETDAGEIQVGSGLHYTMDNGKTWANIPQPTDSSGDSSLVYGVNDGIHHHKIRALPVTVDQQNVTYDIAFTPGTVWISSFAGGLRKSTDMGKTWQRVLLPSDDLNEIKPTDTLNYALQPVSGKFGPEGYLNLRVFSVIAANDSTLYVGTAGGVNKSTDGGVSWIKFNHQNQDNPISGNFIVALGYNKESNTVWAASWQANDPNEFYGVSHSTDGGANWEISLNGENAHNFGFKGTDVICTTDNGAFRSSDNGATWILPNSINEISNNKIEFSITTNTFYSAASSGNEVWLGSASGLAKLDEINSHMWQGQWTIYFTSAKLASNTNAYVYPNPFSPKVDQALNFKYSTGGKTQNVTIRIFDFGMNYVRTLIQNQPRNLSIDSRPDPARWDGRDDKGNIVANGVYFYRIDVGSETPRYGKIIVFQ
jgi:hypothetical protein